MNRRSMTNFDHFDKSTWIDKFWCQMTKMIYVFDSRYWDQGLNNTWAAHVLSFELEVLGKTLRPKLGINSKTITDKITFRVR